MVILAALMVSTPILVMIFFVFYKSFLYFKNKKSDNTELISYNQGVKQSYNNLELQNQNSDFEEDNDDELTAVISSAVSYYLQKTN